MSLPDLHHEGPITIELCDDLIGKLDDRIRALPDESFDLGGWQQCRANWHNQLDYAKYRLRGVKADVEAQKPMQPDYHGRIIDICLCIVRDFDLAKSIDFKKPK